MSLFGFQLCIASIMLTAAVIQPFPIRRVVSRASSSPATADGADSAVKISKKTVGYLTSTSPSSFTSLYHLWSEASYLAREDVLKTKVKRL